MQKQVGLKMLTPFRVLTVLMASAVYMITSERLIPQHFAPMVVVVIASIMVTLLLRRELSEQQILGLAMVELMGYTIIILLTGGLVSPFFMLIFNPAITVVIETHMPKLSGPFIAYFMGLLLLCGLISDGFGQWLAANSVVIFSDAMIAVVVYMLFRSSSSLVQAQKALGESHDSLMKSLQIQMTLNEHLRQSIYLVEKLSSVTEIKQVVQEITLFLQDLSLEGNAFYFLDGEINRLWTPNPYIKDSLIQEIRQLKSTWQALDEPSKANTAEGNQIIYINLLTDEMTITVGILLGANFTQERVELLVQQFSYVAKLYKILTAKIHLTKMRDDMLVKEEQNRIANEMHDHVNQQLFAISCLASQMLTHVDTIERSELKGHLESLYGHLRSVNQDIRSIVYRLSSRKTEADSLKEMVTQYAAELEAMYGIRIHLEVKGQLPEADLALKQTLIRILNESIANAIRHGKANLVEIALDQSEDYLHVRIKDNGVGMDFGKVRDGNGGLGLGNMLRMAAVFNGNLEISSPKDLKEGTELIFHLQTRRGGKLDA